MQKWMVVTSSKGTLLRHVLSVEKCRNVVSAVFVDRHCGAYDVAEQFAVQTILKHSENKKDLSEQIYIAASELGVTDIFLIFDRLIDMDILAKYQGRCYNLHPSLLPAFKGLDSFDRAMKFGARIVGSTIHEVDKGIDSGEIIMQGVTYCDTDVSQIRHRLFVLECKMTMDFLLQNNHSETNFDVVSPIYQFEEGIISPGLLHKESIRFGIPDRI